MELRDIYDAEGRRTGKTITSAQRPGPGERILVVGCWIVNRRGEIFLTKRSPQKRYMPNLWENTGGHAMTGEDGAAAIAREIFEETGVRVEREELILIHRAKSADAFAEEFVAVKDFSVKDVVLQAGETCDARWVNEAEWERMMEVGEIAPGVTEKVLPLKDKLLEILHGLQK